MSDPELNAPSSHDAWPNNSTICEGMCPLRALYRRKITAIHGQVRSGKPSDLLRGQCELLVDLRHALDVLAAR